MEENNTTESRISVRKSGGKRGYDSTWIYIPSRLANDSSFPFKKDDKLMIEVKDDYLLIRKKRVFEDLINTYGLKDGTLTRLIEKKAVENQDKPFLRFKDEIYSYSEVNENSNRFAHGILEIVKKLKLDKKHIAVMLQNCPQFVFSWFGIVKTGSIFIPINYFLWGETLRYVLNESDSEVLIIDYRFLKNLKEIINQLPKIKAIFVVNAPKSFQYDEKYLNIQEIYSTNIKNPNITRKFTDKMQIIFTEGTTGKPKGIVYRNQKIFAGLIISEESKKYVNFKNVYCPIPLFHYFAQLIILMQVIFLNTSIILVENFVPSKFWQDVKKYKPSLIVYHSGIILGLINQPPSEHDRDHGVKWALGGEAPKELWEIFENRFGISLYEGWASTEAMGYAINSLGSKGGKVGSIGKPIEEFDIKIVDLEGIELPPGPDNIGEIITKSTLPIRLEYYKEPENTTMLHGKDGYISTGDFGYKDKDGFIYFVGRKTDMIYNNGEFIPIHIIENITKTHPLVLDSAVIEVSDDTTNQNYMKVCAVLKRENAISHEEFYDYMRENLAHFMVPRYIEFKKRLRTLTGRIKKFKLREEWFDKTIKKNTWDSKSRHFLI